MQLLDMSRSKGHLQHLGPGSQGYVCVGALWAARQLVRWADMGQVMQEPGRMGGAAAPQWWMSVFAANLQAMVCLVVST